MYHHRKCKSLPYRFSLDDIRCTVNCVDESAAKHLPKHISPNTPGLKKDSTIISINPYSKTSPNSKPSRAPTAIIDGEKESVDIDTTKPQKQISASTDLDASTWKVYFVWMNMMIYVVSIVFAIIGFIKHSLQLSCSILILCSLCGLALSFSYKANIIKMTTFKRKLLLQQSTKISSHRSNSVVSARSDGEHAYDINSDKSISLLSSLRRGDFHKQLAISSDDDLLQLLPVVVQSLCAFPFGLTQFRSSLFVVLAQRIASNPILDQRWCFFLNSNRDIATIRRMWEDHEYLEEEENDSITFYRSLFTDLDAIGCIQIVPLSQIVYDPMNGNRLTHVELKQIMPSNGKPYLIECQTAKQSKSETDAPQTIYSSTMLLKQGDDLRKDLGVMLMFKYMNEIWRENSIMYNTQRCEALVYKIVPIAVDFGVIEFVDGATKIAEIDAMINQIHSSDEYNSIIDRLIATASASYVASYICGVRDRHHDNILVRNDGTLFNIDFSHILGEKLGGLDASTIAIPHKFVKILGDNNWNRFIEISVICFFVLRQNYIQLLDYARIVFAFMKTPEENDKFLKHSLMIDVDDTEALKKIRAQFNKAPFKLSTKMKNTFHSLAVASMEFKASSPRATRGSSLSNALMS